MIVLSANDLQQLVMPAALVDAVRSAALAATDADAVVPPRLHVQWASERTLLVMPAAMIDGKCNSAALGTKLVSVVPDNAARGLPVTNGLMVVSDWQTGLPVAILNAATLTAQRTGAVGALAIHHLTPSSLDAVGIIGCGVQGTWQAIFACAVRPIRRIYFLCRSDEAALRFESTVRGQVEWFSPDGAERLEIKRCQNARALIAQADLIITATTSALPVVPDDRQLLSDKHFIGIGSFRPDMQELPDAVCGLAGSLVIDSEAARHETGDVLGPTSRGILKAQNVFHIGEVIAGRRVIDTERTTVFKSVGMALFDLYVATLFVAAARSRGIGQDVTL